MLLFHGCFYYCITNAQLLALCPFFLFDFSPAQILSVLLSWHVVFLFEKKKKFKNHKCVLLAVFPHMFLLLCWVYAFLMRMSAWKKELYGSCEEIELRIKIKGDIYMQCHLFLKLDSVSWNINDVLGAGVKLVVKNVKLGWNKDEGDG